MGLKDIPLINAIRVGSHWHRGGSKANQPLVLGIIIYAANLIIIVFGFYSSFIKEIQTHH